MPRRHLPRRHDRQEELELSAPRFSTARRRLASWLSLATPLALLPTAGCTAPGIGSTGLHLLLDPGHTPEQGGALGIRGLREVLYNDRFCAELAQALRSDGHRVSITRQPGESISLDARAEMANRLKPDLFLSLHHDSAQPQYLEPFEFEGRPAQRTRQPMAGYSVFVSQLNGDWAGSLAWGRQLAAALSALGRPPALHHAEPIAGENRPLLDAATGLYRFDELLVLRKTRVPAVLLEVGLIVDERDEALVSDAGQRARIIQALGRAVAVQGRALRTQG